MLLNSRGGNLCDFKVCMTHIVADQEMFVYYMSKTRDLNDYVLRGKSSIGRILIWGTFK